MEMRELHGEVARLQALGLAFSDVKAEIGRVVAAQQACRDALAAAKAASSGSSGSDSEGNAPDKQEQECWMLRPGGVWLRLPAARAEVVLRAGEAGCLRAHELQPWTVNVLHWPPLPALLHLH